jgi:opine dehydrogenase
MAFLLALALTRSYHVKGVVTTACWTHKPEIPELPPPLAPNRTIKAPPCLDHRYIHEDVGYGLVPMAALGRLAGVATPTMDALVQLVSVALGVDYARDGLTLERLGLAGKSPAELVTFAQQGDA